jgi:hypothetical protein
MVSLGVCSVLFGSFVGACSDDAEPPAADGGSDSGANAGGEDAGGSPMSLAGQSATDSLGGALSSAGGESSDGGTAPGVGGAAAGSDGEGGSAGNSGQEPSLDVGPAPGWVSYRGSINDGPSVGEQALAVDPRGNGDAVLVWAQTNEEGKSDIVANHYSAGVWSTPQVIDGLPGSAAEPHVTIDGQGNAMAIWQQQDDQDRSGIFFARYLAKTATWTTASFHEVGPAPYGASHPRVAADGAGNVLATWNLAFGTDDGGTGTRVMASFYSGAAKTPSWTMPESLGSPGEPQTCGRPRVALSSAGHGFVVWDDATGADASQRRVYAAHYIVNGAFGITQGLNQFNPGEEPAQVEEVPEIIMNDAGQALATWRQVGVSGSVGVALSWFLPQLNQWAAQPDIREGGTMIGVPALALAKSGAFAVSYWDARFGKRQLAVNHGKIDVQGTIAWSAAVTLLETATAGGDPSLAVEQGGAALLAWIQPLKGVDNLLVGRSIPAGARSFGTLQADLSRGAASPTIRAYPGTNLGLVTYLEKSDIRSTTTEAE